MPTSRAALGVERAVAARSGAALNGLDLRGIGQGAGEANHKVPVAPCQAWRCREVHVVGHWQRDAANKDREATGRKSAKKLASTSTHAGERTKGKERGAHINSLTHTKAPICPCLGLRWDSTKTPRRAKTTPKVAVETLPTLLPTTVVDPKWTCDRVKLPVIV